MTVLAAVLGAGAALAGGCSTESASTAATEGPTAPLKDEPPNTGNTQSPTDEDATVKAAPYVGNPLCYVDVDPAAKTCDPDEDTYRFSAGTCQPPAVDGGDAAGTGTPTGACRVTSEDGGFGAKCSAGVTPSGGDGASCAHGNDCAAGFDCVGGGGTKSCRRYCCAGTCAAQTSQNGGSTFCDVQSLVDVTQQAPVCMPLKRCKLLGTGECTVTETCAVVTESGDTGCVAIGEGQVGASCDKEHCAAKLTCLGQPGSRKCYKLCKVSSNDCGPSLVCETSTVFRDPTFGTCQKPK